LKDYQTLTDSRLLQIFAMREAYERFLENNSEQAVNGATEDPFVIPKEDRILGLAHVYLKSLCYLLPISRNFFLVDPTGQQFGTIRVEIIPKVLFLFQLSSNIL